jgi:hypothetical protein
MKDNIFATTLLTIVFYVGISFGCGTFSVTYWDTKGGGTSIAGFFYVLFALIINIGICNNTWNNNDEKLF